MMLTDAAIRKLPARPSKDELIPSGDRLGLYLRVRVSGSKTWMTRRRVGGVWRVETLGRWPQLSALNARRMASTATPRIAAAITFGDAVQQFYAEEILPKYRSAPHETLAYLTRDCTPINARRLDRVTRGDLVKLVRAKLATAPNAAAKMLAVLKKFFAWAAIGELIEADPIAGLTARALSIPAQSVRERKLTDDELRALWAMPDEPYGRLLKFALLTACRIGEAQQITPEQIVDGVWTIPLTKNNKAHTVPLSPTAAALAAEGWPLRSYNSLHAAFVASGVTWRAHDLRRTAATRMVEAGVPVDAVESTLNHVRPKLLRTYQQADPLPAMRDALLRLEAAVLEVVAQPAQKAAA
jgi:integrase